MLATPLLADVQINVVRQSPWSWSHGGFGYARLRSSGHVKVFTPFRAKAVQSEAPHVAPASGINTITEMAKIGWGCCSKAVVYSPAVCRICRKPANHPNTLESASETAAAQRSLLRKEGGGRGVQPRKLCLHRPPVTLVRELGFPPGHHG